MAVPRVAALHDISGMGRCSLTAAIPILSAMGVQVCPLPMAVLSNQTGYPSYASVELTGELARFAEQWAQRGAQFDGIYTGFLCNPEQVAFAERFIEQFGGGLVLIDPVLGDNGALYPVFDDAMRRAVLRLVARAQVVTPNLTEACLLTGADAATVGANDVWPLARALAALGPDTVVITGVHAGERIRNACWLAQEEAGFWVETRRSGGGYSGTGDVLASVLCGGLVRGDSPHRALELAGRLLERAAARSYADGTDPNDGVAFEPYLHTLMLEEETQ